MESAPASPSDLPPLAVITQEDVAKTTADAIPAEAVALEQLD
jgi:hypothetical protein